MLPVTCTDGLYKSASMALCLYLYEKKRLVKCTEYKEWYESDTGADLFPAQTIDSCSL